MKKSKSVEALVHSDEKRINIPTAENENIITIDKKPLN